MDPNTVVLEISSDEEAGWDGHGDRGIADGGDDHNWIAKLLDEVNRDDCHYDCGYNDGGDDSDEVVLVSEVLPLKKPRKKLKSKSSSLIDLDDDCVMLDHDPSRPVEARNHNPIDRGEDDDSDDLLVVSEKGQVACRDYPHPRHLCIKFPFSSTPNQSHCNQCYCYVCDSLAPCVYWGNGSASLDHCCATEKDEFWKLERKNSKNSSNGVQPAPKVAVIPPVETLSAAHNHVQRPGPVGACPIPSNFGVPNTINQNQTAFLLSRNKYQPGLVSQQLIKNNSCGDPRDRVHHSYNLDTSTTPFHRPVFKRTGSTGVATTMNRYPYSSYRDTYINPCRQSKYSGSSQSNLVNSCGPFSPSNVNSFPLAFQPDFPHQPTTNTQFEFSPNFPSPVENAVVYQSHVAPCLPPSDGQSIVSDYSQNVCQQGMPAQSSTTNPNFTHEDVNWVPTDPCQGTGTEGSVATVCGGMVEYEYEKWIVGNEGCEAGSFGLNDFASEPAFIDAGTIFDF